MMKYYPVEPHTLTTLLLAFVATLINFVVVTFTFDFVKSGDIIAYNLFYDYVSVLNYADQSTVDPAYYIGSNDFIYVQLVWLFSRFFDFKSFFIFQSLVYFIVVQILFIRSNLSSFLILLPVSFYVVGLQFSANRLELAITIFFLFYFSSRKYLSCLAIFAHAQIAPLLILLLTKRNVKQFLIITVLVCALFYFIVPHVFDKIVLYVSERNFDLLSIIYSYTFILFSAAILILSGMKLRSQEFTNMVIFVPLLFFLGQARMNVLIYFYVITCIRLLRTSNSSRILLLLFLLFDNFKGLAFVCGLYQGNSGFDSLSNFRALE